MKKILVFSTIILTSCVNSVDRLNYMVPPVRIVAINNGVVMVKDTNNKVEVFGGEDVVGVALKQSKVGERIK